MRANSVTLFGHIQKKSGRFSLGERGYALKFQTLLKERGYKIHAAYDIFHFFGNLYEPLARLNYDLASNNHPILDTFSYKEIQKLSKALQVLSGGIIITLSWCWSLAALLALGIHKKNFFVSKLYVHHTQQKIPSLLYENCHLLITESLLANQRAIAYGISPSKVLYIPHHYPLFCEKISHNRKYASTLSEKTKKTFRKTTILIGVVSRLEYGKNCEYALQVVKELFEEGFDIRLILKGNLPQETPYLPYRENLKSLLSLYETKEWLLWDQRQSSHKQILYECASFDICLHLSGAEAGSNTIVEFLALGKPTLVLEVSTNPFLFQGGVLFVKAEKQMRPALVPFYTPNFKDLKEKLRALISSASLRQGLGKQAKQLARKRFHPHNTWERLPLIFESAQARSATQQKILSLYKKDLTSYRL